MKSTKYQLLKDDFDHACRELKLRNELIKELREENELLNQELRGLRCDKGYTGIKLKMKNEKIIRYEKALNEICEMYKETKKPVLDNYGMIALAKYVLDLNNDY